MRPLALRVKGFTSFRDEQEIDFRDLDLFALWGPTGSGKSSILDAITYSLYGKVERVEGIRTETISSLITHGQPRMAVTFEFESGAKTFRITRATTLGGQTKVRLDRLEGEDWVSFGEGGDSVREVNRIVPRLVGLDYDAFTRSVVLPQGRFAEFLTGDAAQRREILTELLGLELFGRMAQRSNEVAREAKATVEANTRVVEAEYAGIDEAAVKRAAAEAKDLEAEATKASEIENQLEQLEDEWTEHTESIDALLDLGTEIKERGASYETHAATLERHARELEVAAAVARASKEKLDAARADNERLTAERSSAEDEHGSLEELAGRKAALEALENLEREVTRAEKVAGEQDGIRAKAERDLATHAKTVATAEKAALAAREEVELRETEHDRAHRADLVGALTHSLAPGDPCPVCERPLEQLPASDAAALTEAKELRIAAQEKARSTQEALAAARVKQARAEEALEAAVRRCGECATEADEKKRRLDQARSQIEDQIGSDLAGALGDIEKRAGALRQLIAAEQKAASGYASMLDEARAQQDAQSKVATKVASVRGSLEGSSVKQLLVQVKRSLGRAPKVSMPTSLPDEPDALAKVARRSAEQLVDVGRELDEEVRSRREHAEGLVAKAAALLPPELDVETSGIKAMLADIRRACRKLGQEAALASREAKTVAAKLDKRRELEAGIEVQRSLQAVYGQLGRELKNDRIVQFLQAEALGVLAAAAGEHLRELSDERYRLIFEDDRFYVVDAWNGDERRSVRTLSGGETFLASLGLALALSEQVQMLAVTERARLQSLFLDEGFGSLDAETLDIVVGAISRLGSDGRLVGVITHVPELAEAMPVRIEVLKGPRGSTIQVGDQPSVGAVT